MVGLPEAIEGGLGALCPGEGGEGHRHRGRDQRPEQGMRPPAIATATTGDGEDRRERARARPSILPLARHVVIELDRSGRRKGGVSLMLVVLATPLVQ